MSDDFVIVPNYVETNQKLDRRSETLRREWRYAVTGTPSEEGVPVKIIRVVHIRKGITGARRANYIEIGTWILNGNMYCPSDDIIKLPYARYQQMINFYEDIAREGGVGEKTFVRKNTVLRWNSLGLSISQVGKNITLSSALAKCVCETENVQLWRRGQSGNISTDDSDQ